MKRSQCGAPGQCHTHRTVHIDCLRPSRPKEKDRRDWCSILTSGYSCRSCRALQFRRGKKHSLSETLKRKEAMKKTYETPAVHCLGSVERLTLVNQTDPFSDVPQGDISQSGNNPPFDGPLEIS